VRPTSARECSLNSSGGQLPAGQQHQTYTGTLNSRNASFSEVLRLVLSLRCPMMSAQLTP